MRLFPGAAYAPEENQRPRGAIKWRSGSGLNGKALSCQKIAEKISKEYAEDKPPRLFHKKLAPDLRRATINAPPPMGPLGGLTGDPGASFSTGGTIPKGGYDTQP